MRFAKSKQGQGDFMQSLCPLFYYANITLSSVPVVFSRKNELQFVFCGKISTATPLHLTRRECARFLPLVSFWLPFSHPLGPRKRANPKKRNSKTSKTFCNYSATLSEFSNSPVSGFTRTVPDFRQIPLQRFEKYTVRLLATSKASCISFASK